MIVLRTFLIGFVIAFYTLLAIGVFASAIKK